MKKLCYVTTVSITVKAFLLPVLRHLRKETDWELTVICDDDPALQELLPEGVRYIPVSMKRGISIGGIGAMLKMTRIFRKEKFDLVQYSTPNAGLYASVAAWLAGIRLRKYHLMGFRFLGFSGFRRKLFRGIEKLACRLSTDVECVSASNLELGVQNGIFPRDKASVLYHGSSAGVDLERFDIDQKTLWRTQVRRELGLAEQDCVFCFAGRITGDKGINELLGAFRQMHGEQDKLLLIGMLEDEETLEPDLLAWARADSSVCLHGFVQDIERYFAAADVLVLPSYREGFGNIVIEAQAMGVPVIVSDIPGPTDAMLPEKTGLTVPVRDVPALTNAMSKLSADRQRREEMGRNGRLLIEQQFDQKILTEQILADRKRLLGE